MPRIIKSLIIGYRVAGTTSFPAVRGSHAMLASSRFDRPLHRQLAALAPVARCSDPIGVRLPRPLTKIKIGRQQSDYRKPQAPTPLTADAWAIPVEQARYDRIALPIAGD